MNEGRVLVPSVQHKRIQVSTTSILSKKVIRKELEDIIPYIISALCMLDVKKYVWGDEKDDDLFRQNRNLKNI